MYRTHSAATCAVFLVFCLIQLGCLQSRQDQEHWDRFRGPNGSGVSSATSIPAKWRDEDFNWKLKLPGIGHSSPVVWGNKVFVTSGDPESGTRTILCVDTAGKERWRSEFPAAKHEIHVHNSFASATPAVDAGRVYVAWGTPDELAIMALDHLGGLVWRADLGPFKAGHGFGASPIVHGNLLIVPNDQGGESVLVGMNRFTGDVMWRVPRESQTSYATPCVYRRPSGDYDLVFTNWNHGITAIDPLEGRTTWEGDVFDRGHIECAIASPIVADGVVFATAGWLGVKNEVVAVRPAVDGASVEELFRIERSAPLVPTPLAVDGLLFLWDDVGIVTCADVTSGEIYWKQRVGGSYYGSPVWVGGRLYAVSIDGEVCVLAASPTFRVLARNQLGEGSHSTPAVAGGRMYIRTFSHLISVGGRDS